MTAAITSSRPSPLLRAFTGVLCAALAFSPLPAAAASPASFGMFAAAPAPASTGNTIGLFRLSGDPASAEALRSQILTDMSAAGYNVKGVALDIDGAAGKVKCKGGADACVGKVIEWLNKGAAKSGTVYDYLIYGTVGGPNGASSIVIYDVAKKAKVKEFTPSLSPDDLILPLALPRAMVTSLNNYRTPAAPATAEEQKILAELDEPAKTPEELAAEKAAIDDAIGKVAAGQGELIDTSNVKVDLKKDFKDFCRTGPPKPRVNKDDPKDLRPVCKRGPTFGYFQTRAWVALGLTAGALLTTGIFYSLGLAARGPYKSALDDLDNSGLDKTDPLQSDEYTRMAADVADKGNTMRNRLIGGDVALLTTVLLAGVLAVIIYQDRTDAKDFIKTEKSLKSVSRIQNVRGGPILSRGMQGFGFGFNF
ncbi:hypothetical protein [Nannocystis pusilla]|uniref:hypothetical protein n=1 Tax=Nannocystis pusilla TaxID=889268 RepID=UPI003DA4E9E6